MFPVAGVNFSDFSEVRHTIKVGDLIKAVPEPNNPFDKKAVALFYKNVKIGYVPRGKQSSAKVFKVARLNMFENYVVGLEVVEHKLNRR